MLPRRESLGKRYTCPSCGIKFYDLNKPEAICPKCKTKHPGIKLSLKKSAPIEDMDSDVEDPELEDDDSDDEDDSDEEIDELDEDFEL